MLTIRLRRGGRANQPFFKIVVTEKTTSSTRGRFAEELGFYNPLTKEKKINAERAKYWISVGAKPSDTIHNLFVREKVIEGAKIPNHKKSKKTETTPPSPATPPVASAQPKAEPTAP